MAGQWMTETRKTAPEPVFKMGGIIIALVTICDEITDILEEVMCGCYFDDVESIIEAIITKKYCNMQKHGYSKKLLKLFKEFEVEHNKLEDIRKEIMTE